MCVVHPKKEEDKQRQIKFIPVVFTLEKEFHAPKDDMQMLLDVLNA